MSAAKLTKKILSSKLSIGENQIKAGQTIPSSILSLNRIIQLHAEVLYINICKSNLTQDVKKSECNKYLNCMLHTFPQF